MLSWLNFFCCNGWFTNDNNKKYIKYLIAFRLLFKLIDTGKTFQSSGKTKKYWFSGGNRTEPRPDQCEEVVK